MSKTASAPTTNGGKPTVSPADYVEIEQLYGWSNIALDSGLEHGGMFARTFVPEGSTVSTAILNIADGALIQDLPFMITLKKFTVEHYSTGMPKLFASEMAEKVCSAAIQVHGGYGYVSDFPVERIYRDVRVCQIYEGTSEVQKILIGRALA